VSPRPTPRVARRRPAGGTGHGSAPAVPTGAVHHGEVLGIHIRAPVEEHQRCQRSEVRHPTSQPDFEVVAPTALPGVGDRCSESKRCGPTPGGREVRREEPDALVFTGRKGARLRRNNFRQARRLVERRRRRRPPGCPFTNCGTRATRSRPRSQGPRSATSWPDADTTRPAPRCSILHGGANRQKPDLRGRVGGAGERGIEPAWPAWKALFRSGLPLCLTCGVGCPLVPRMPVEAASDRRRARRGPASSTLLARSA
jgi:hypothetical protein